MAEVNKVNGRVVTGFSKPYAALYSTGGSDASYSGGMPLARGVSVKLNVKAKSTPPFCCDNNIGESDNGEFESGTVDLEVDGMHPAAEKLVLGLGAPETVSMGSGGSVTVTQYGDGTIPYVGVGYITEYTSGGVKIYVPTMLRKAKFHQPSGEAHTRGERTEWQTQKLVADLLRDDTATHPWKWVGEDFATEAEADAALKLMLGIGAGA